MLITIWPTTLEEYEREKKYEIWIFLFYQNLPANKFKNLRKFWSKIQFEYVLEKLLLMEAHGRIWNDEFQN